MTHRETIINIVKRVKRMTETFGHSNIFATLSQVLTASHTLLRFAGVRASIYGFSCIRAREAALFFIPLARETN